MHQLVLLRLIFFFRSLNYLDHDSVRGKKLDNMRNILPLVILTSMCRLIAIGETEQFQGSPKSGSTESEVNSNTVTKAKLQYYLAKQSWSDLVSIGEAAVPLLSRIALTDDSWEVRREAMNSLAEIGETSAIRPLVKILMNFRTGDEAKTAFEALRKLGYVPPNTEEAALFWLASSGCKWRNHVARQSYFDDDFNENHNQPLGVLLQSTTNASVPFCSLLRKLKSRSQWDDAVYVAHLLGRIGNTNATDALVSVADGKDLVKTAYVNVADKFPLTTAAVHSLGRLRDQRSVEHIIGLIRRPAGNEVLKECAFALGEIGDASAIVPLGRMLHKEHVFLEYDEDYRPAAITALSKFGNRSSEWLVRTLKSSEVAFGRTDEGGGVPIRELAIIALGKTGARSAVQPLSTVLDDNDPKVRILAVDALAQISDSGAIQPLKKLLGDSNAAVRKHAAEALDRLGWKP